MPNDNGRHVRARLLWRDLERLGLRPRHEVAEALLEKALAEERRLAEPKPKKARA